MLFIYAHRNHMRSGVATERGCVWTLFFQALERQTVKQLASLRAKGLSGAKPFVPLFRTTTEDAPLMREVGKKGGGGVRVKVKVWVMRGLGLGFG